MSPRIVTVFGATGVQGSSVVNALLADGTFIPRAITRDDTSEAAQKLKAAGAEVFKADLSDVESLKKAIQGSEAVYLITFPFNPAFTEKTQATLILEASKAVGVKYLIWSTLPSITEASGGTLTHAKQFDDKGEIDKLVESSGIPHSKVYLGYFDENLWMHHHFKSNNSGGFDWILPRTNVDSKQCFVWTGKEAGLSALALLKKYTESPSEVVDKSFVIANVRTTYREAADILTKVLGKRVNFVSPETIGMPAIDEMFESLSKYGWYHDAIIPDPRLVSWGALSSSFEEFVIANKATLLSC